MNTIRRPRRHPRRRSINLRAFCWVLVREAAYNVVRLPWEQLTSQKEARRWLARMPTDRVRALVDHYIARDPRRRHAP